MDPKSKIKIDSFEVTRLYLTDIPDILKLAISAQSSFGVSPHSSPTVFLEQISKVLQQNTRHSFVFRHKNKAGAAFIIKPQTTKTAELLYCFADANAIQTSAMYDTFINTLNDMRFDTFYAPVYKKRKKFEAYIRFLNLFGFKKVFNDNDLYLTLVYEKPK
jgi:hypothetical protein